MRYIQCGQKHLKKSLVKSSSGHTVLLIKMSALIQNVCGPSDSSMIILKSSSISHEQSVDNLY